MIEISPLNQLPNAKIQEVLSTMTLGRPGTTDEVGSLAHDSLQMTVHFFSGANFDASGGWTINEVPSVLEGPAQRTVVAVLNCLHFQFWTPGFVSGFANFE